MHGSRFCAATACARRCFFTVSGKYEPPFTVASFATTTTWRPATTPIPVTIPALGASPSYTSHAARAFSSRKAVSGSTSRSIRSRAVSLPRARWRSTARSPPPRATNAVRSRSSSTRPSIRSRRRANSSERSTCEVRTATHGDYPPTLAADDGTSFETAGSRPGCPDHAVHRQAAEHAGPHAPRLERGARTKRVGRDRSVAQTSDRLRALRQPLVHGQGPRPVVSRYTRGSREQRGARGGAVGRHLATLARPALRQRRAADRPLCAARLCCGRARPRHRDRRRGGDGRGHAPRPALRHPLRPRRRVVLPHRG